MSTAICVVDAKGKIVREGVVITDPETIAAFIGLHAPDAVRIGLERRSASVPTLGYFTWLTLRICMFFAASAAYGR
jgi:hypothetical protein